MMDQLSLEVYYNKVVPKLSQKQGEILEILKKIGRPATNMMIANELGWSINRVTPRVLELRKEGIVTRKYRAKCPITHNKASYWGFMGGMCK